jgi:YkgG family uncharacterized protein
MDALVPNLDFSVLASDDQIARTTQALEANHIQTLVVETGDEARSRVLGLLPARARVYQSASRTLELTGLAADIDHSTTFQPVRPMVRALDRATQQPEIRRLCTSPDVLVGSVHAITEQGQVLVASAAGNQLGAAAFGASRVIWVVGTQKLVRTLDDGLRRIREYCHPLEDARTRAVYGQPSAINKILIVNGELPGRMTIILVKQNLGF